MVRAVVLGRAVIAVVAVLLFLCTSDETPANFKDGMERVEDIKNKRLSLLTVG